MRPSPLPLALVAALVAAALAGCAPGIHVKRYRPPVYNLGSTRKVALLNVQGPPEALGVVATELSSQIVQTGYFQLHSPTPQPMTVILLPGNATVQNIEAVRAAVPAEVYVSAAVTRWQYSEREEHVEETHDGQKLIRHLRVPQASVSVHYQVIQAATGRVVVAQEFTRDAEGSRYDPHGAWANPADVLREACAATTAVFLQHVTPATVDEKIVLDDDEEDLEPGIELCKKGALDAAMQAFEKVLQARPNSPGATYNVAVLHEVRGDYTKADEFYGKAYALKRKKLYREAREAMQRRIAEDESLRRPL